MTSFAEFRRNCTPGRAVHVDNRYRPEVSGDRTIIKASTVTLTMTPPEGTDAKTFKTTLDWPKAALTEVSDDGLELLIRFGETDSRRVRQIERTLSDIFLILTLN